MRKGLRVRVPLWIMIPLAVAVGGWVSQPSMVTAEDSFTEVNEQELVASDDPLAMDALAYSEHFGVTPEEALKRLKLQQEIGELDGDLTAFEARTYGGLWIEHQPSFGVVVALTADSDRVVATYVDPTSAIAGIIEVRIVDDSLADLRAVQQTLRDKLQGDQRDYDTRINVESNRVEVLTHSDEAFDSARSVLDESEVAVVRAGGRFVPAYNMYAGRILADCTTGFSVEDTDGAPTGMATAAHCSDTQEFNGINLPYQDGQRSGSLDAQWHTTPQHTDQNWAKDNSTDEMTPGYRLIINKTSRANQAINSWVCTYGKVAPNFTCGELIDKNFNSGGCVPSANNTWMRLDGQGTDIADPGDSGGPVYSGNYAWGVMTCEEDGGDDAVYMAQNYLADIGVRVLTS